MHYFCQINAMFVGSGGPFSLTCARLSRSMLPAIWLRLAADTSDVIVTIERGSGRCSYTGVDVLAEVEVGPEKRQKHHPLFIRGTTNDISKQQSCDCCSICLNSSTDLDNKGCARLQRSKPSCMQNAPLDVAKCQAKREKEASHGISIRLFCQVSSVNPSPVRPTVI